MVKKIVTFMSFLAFTTALVSTADAAKKRVIDTPIQGEEDINPPPAPKKAKKTKRVHRAIARHTKANLLSRFDDLANLPDDESSDGTEF